jgi:hypothetical protein
MMALSRPTVALTVLTLAIASLLGLLIWDATRPLKGDWRPDKAFDESRFTIRLKRLTTGPWSQPIPEIAERERTLDRPADSDAFYLFIEFAVQLDGKPLPPWPEIATRGPGIPNFHEPDLSYRGQKLQSDGASALLPGTQPGSFVMASGGVSPWKRGLGPGEFIVRQKITFEFGDKVDAEFRFSAR